MEWFEIENTDQVLSPALLFFPDRIQKNIDRMIEIAGSSTRLRPHIKTNKSTKIIQMQLEAGIEKFKCATIAEAILLAQLNAHDVLIAYPLIGPGRHKFLELVKHYPRTKFSILMDSSTEFKAWEVLTHEPINIFIDVDVGMERTGINPNRAFELYQEIEESSHHFKGLHCYDGHIRTSNFEGRKKVVDEAFENVDVLINRIGRLDFELVCGGSVTFPIHANSPNKQLSPGTTLLWDYGYGSNFPDLGMDIAAVLLSRIISKPGNDKICLDLGHKSLASEMADLRVYFPQLPNAKRVVHSEEHLVLSIEDSSQWNVGDVLYGFPWHICPTVALHQQAAVVKDNKVEEFWDIEGRNRVYQL